MRRTLKCLLTCLASTVAFAQPALAGPARGPGKGSAWVRVVTNGYTKLAYGNGCVPESNGGVTCGTIVAADLLDVYDSYGNSLTYASLSVTEYVVGGRFDGSYRVLDCPMTFTDFNVAPSGATLAVNVDTAAPACSRYGQLFDSELGTSVDWFFTGTLAVSGAWSSPHYLSRERSTGTKTDTLNGKVRRYTCELSQGDSAAGTFSLGANTYVMVNTVEPPDASNTGSYVYKPCRDAVVTR